MPHNKWSSLTQLFATQIVVFTIIRLRSLHYAHYAHFITLIELCHNYLLRDIESDFIMLLLKAYFNRPTKCNAILMINENVPGAIGLRGFTPSQCLLTTSLTLFALTLLLSQCGLLWVLLCNPPSYVVHIPSPPRCFLGLRFAWPRKVCGAGYAQPSTMYHTISLKP